MKITKAEKRDKSRSKRKYSMRVSGKSVFLIQSVIVERANSAQKKVK